MTPAKPYYQDDTVTLYHGDCLELMNEIPDGSVDMVMADLPYGTTACKWDSVIPFEPLWAAYRRVCKKNAAIVLTASQPFTSALVMSNVTGFSHNWSWKKRPVNFLNAKKQPMRNLEDVLVFGRNLTYNPQGLVAKRRVNKRSNSTETNGVHGFENVSEFTNYPHQVIEIINGERGSHPTQKPVALMEYLIRTYTNEGETVLDNTMGSGTTGVACINTGRGFIGIEQDEKYCGIAATRISGAVKPVTAELQLA
jgi:site-specific DNA-methyltransferase (adenine-specific)